MEEVRRGAASSGGGSSATEAEAFAAAHGRVDDAREKESKGLPTTPVGDGAKG